MAALFFTHINEQAGFSMLKDDIFIIHLSFVIPYPPRPATCQFQAIAGWITKID